MNDPDRWLRNRRDAGLASVGRWTRAAVAAGVVLSGVLAAGVAHLLPWQADAAGGQATPAAPPAAPAGGHTTAAPRQTEDDGGSDGVVGDDSGEHTPKAKKKRHTAPLAPPVTVPSPTQSPSHATSGGS
jgi:hypothetical protein